MSKTHNPNVCPACGSENINSDKVEADGSSANAVVKCLDCKATWTEVWESVGLENVFDANGQPIVIKQAPKNHSEHTTYRELAERIGQMPEDRLDDDVMVFINGIGEAYRMKDFGGYVDMDQQGDLSDAVLNEGQYLIVI